MRTNLQMRKEIEEGNEITQIADRYKIKPAENDFEPIKTCKWWLENLFKKAHLSFAKGAIVFFVILVLPTLIFVPYIIQSSWETQIGSLLDCIGFLTVLVILVPLNLVNKGLRDMVKQVNESTHAKYVAPKNLITKESLRSSESLKKLDKDYQNQYIKPVVFKTLKSGYDLSFNKGYQIGSGVIAAAFFATLIFLKYGLKVLPNSILEFWKPPLVTEVATAWLAYQLFVDILTWFLIGMLVWSLFVTFLITLQISSQTISIRAFEPVRQFFQPTTRLVLWVSFALSAIVAWSTFSLVWGVLPSDPTVRQSTISFMEVALAVLIPIVILSLVIPFVSIHRGMQSSCQRALCIKQHKLEELRENPDPNFDRNLSIQTHLIEDYQLILANPYWPLTSSQIIEGIGTILLPIITFSLNLLLGTSA